LKRHGCVVIQNGNNEQKVKTDDTLINWAVNEKISFKIALPAGSPVVTTWDNMVETIKYFFVMVNRYFHAN
jgi:hypothetical protein